MGLGQFIYPKFPSVSAGICRPNVPRGGVKYTLVYTSARTTSMTGYLLLLKDRTFAGSMKQEPARVLDWPACTPRHGAIQLKAVSVAVSIP